MDALPYIVCVENDPFDAELAHMQLEPYGCTIVIARTIIEGETIITSLATQSEQPLLALLDVKVPIPHHAELESHVLAAVVQRRIEQGLLRPMWLVALTSYLTAEREQEAKFAGFHSVLQKPLNDRMARMIGRMVAEPPPYPKPPATEDLGRILYQERAEELLALVKQSIPFQQYTPEDMHLLLSTITHYPVPPHVNEGRRAGVLASLGGVTGARTYLSRWCQQQTKDSIPAHILYELLHDRDPREHIQHAHRSTIYRNFQSLPQHIARTFRIDSSTLADPQKPDN